MSDFELLSLILAVIGTILIPSIGIILKLFMLYLDERFKSFVDDKDNNKKHKKE